MSEIIRVKKYAIVTTWKGKTMNAGEFTCTPPTIKNSPFTISLPDGLLFDRKKYAQIVMRIRKSELKKHGWKDLPTKIVPVWLTVEVIPPNAEVHRAGEGKP